MININNKSWEKLHGTDIKRFLSSEDDERFFVEFKSDDESNDKLMKEVSAFANTYGGYIFLGVNNDKSIGGCHKWTEQRIHTTIHDSITPIPNFDVRRFKIEKKTVLVIKIDEGALPPYITNKGQIYERVSSGSFPIKDSAKLGQLYTKHQDQLAKIKNKIELPLIRLDNSCPNNLCGYIDVGFNVVTSGFTKLYNEFYQFDFSNVADYLKKAQMPFSISRVGSSILVTVGGSSVTNDHGEKLLMTAGLNNFIEIMVDGSVRCRVILSKALDNEYTSVTSIVYYLHVIFREIYSLVMGEELAKLFVYAQKYERLTVLRQFTPNYILGSNEKKANIERFHHHLLNQMSKYGGNTIVEGNRYPRNDYNLIDRRWFDNMEIQYTATSLFDALFSSIYANLGYIDQIPQLETETSS